MPTTAPAAARARAFRIDKFAVPPACLARFLARLRRIQEMLAGLAGCRQSLVLNLAAGPAEFNVVTVVEWASTEAMERAKVLVQAWYAEEGFDPASFMASLGVRADLGVYVEAEREA